MFPAPFCQVAAASRMTVTRQELEQVWREAHREIEVCRAELDELRRKIRWNERWTIVAVGLSFAAYAGRVIGL